MLLSTFGMQALRDRLKEAEDYLKTQQLFVETAKPEPAPSYVQLRIVFLKNQISALKHDIHNNQG